MPKVKTRRKYTRKRKPQSKILRFISFIWRIVKIPKVAVICVLALSFAWFYYSGYYARSVGKVMAANDYVSKKSGLVLKDILLEGQVHTPKQDIIKILTSATIEDDEHLTIGNSMLDIDLKKIKKKLERLTWVKYASVERLYPSTLSVSIIERKPVALWQHDSVVQLIDDEGKVINTKNIEQFSDLLIMVGDEAPSHTDAIFNLLNAEPELAKRVSSVIRVGKRRWNVKFFNNIEVKLPEEEPTKAWKYLAQMQTSSRILDTDVKDIDLRLKDKVFVK